jgi:hypothetical protein
MIFLTDFADLALALIYQVIKFWIKCYITNQSVTAMTFNLLKIATNSTYYKRHLRTKHITSRVISCQLMTTPMSRIMYYKRLSTYFCFVTRWLIEIGMRYWTESETVDLQIQTFRYVTTCWVVNKSPAFWRH